MIRQKMENQIRFLKRLMHARPGRESQFKDAIDTIEKMISSLDSDEGNLDDIRNRLMGLEGTAGRVYFKCLSKLMPEKYRFDGRSRRPAQACERHIQRETSLKFPTLMISDWVITFDLSIFLLPHVIFF